MLSFLQRTFSTFKYSNCTFSSGNFERIQKRQILREFGKRNLKLRLRWWLGNVGKERGKVCKVLSLCPSLIFLAIYKSKKLDWEREGETFVWYRVCACVCVCEREGGEIKGWRKKKGNGISNESTHEYFTFLQLSK